MATRSNITIEELEQIDRYLHGDMDALEQKQFEEALSANNGLKDKTTELQLLFIGVGEAALRDKLSAFHQEIKMDAIAAKTKIVSLRTWLLAASAAAALFFGIWVVFFNKEPNAELFARYYKPDVGLPTVMSTSGNYEFEKAMVDYKTGNYKAAIESWESLTKTNAQNDTLEYFLGSALLANGEEEKAVSYLKSVAENSGSYFQKDACWYAGLAYLRNGNKELATKYIGLSDKENKTELLNELR